MQNRLGALLGCGVISILLLAGCTVRPVQPAGPEGPQGVVVAAYHGWSADPVDPAVVEPTLSHFASNAVVTLVGLPSGTETYTGTEAIGAWMKGLIDLGFRAEVAVTGTDGDTVTTLTRTWMNPTRQMGIAPLEATETFVIQDGLIQSESWVITPASLEMLSAAMAAAQAKSAAGPAENPAELPVRTIDDVTGDWLFTLNGSDYVLELKSDGTYAVGHLAIRGDVGTGTYTVADGRLKFLTASMSCASAPMGTYAVSVIQKADASNALHFEKVEDNCTDRTEALHGVTLEAMM